MDVPEWLAVLDPAYDGAVPCFTGTRVPTQYLFDYLTGGRLPAQFLVDFPEVSRAQVSALLELAGSDYDRSALTAHVSYSAELVWMDPGRTGGTPCFTETRVPVQYIFDYLEAGDSLELFPVVLRSNDLA